IEVKISIPPGSTVKNFSLDKAENKIQVVTEGPSGTISSDYVFPKISKKEPHPLFINRISKIGKSIEDIDKPEVRKTYLGTGIPEVPELLASSPNLGESKVSQRETPPANLGSLPKQGKTLGDLFGIPPGPVSPPGSQTPEVGKTFTGDGSFDEDISE